MVKRVEAGIAGRQATLPTIDNSQANGSNVNEISLIDPCLLHLQSLLLKPTCHPAPKNHTATSHRQAHAGTHPLMREIHAHARAHTLQWLSSPEPCRPQPLNPKPAQLPTSMICSSCCLRSSTTLRPLTCPRNVSAATVCAGT
jgi:hypothetical protein